MANPAAPELAERSPGATRTRLVTWQDPSPAATAGARLAGLDYMRALAAGELPPPPFAVLLRIAPVEVGEGRVVFEGEPGEEHYNPIGTVHGGYASTLLDSAIGCAVHTTLPAGHAYATQTLEAKFVRPITRETGAVRCEAQVLYRGGRQATGEARLWDVASNQLLAHGTGTCLIIS
ncbi:MAG: hotdog fold thioesterase [Solirubrobacterales bacterium]|nr:hotdog fold thioesterase [Solirubrobacterales bacterium]